MQLVALALGGLALGADGVPLGAEGVDALALDVAGSCVVGEVVERVTVVGHLHLAVLALGGAEQARLHARAGGGSAGRGQRRPRRSARAVARARAALVGLEEIERAAAGVDQER